MTGMFGGALGIPGMSRQPQIFKSLFVLQPVGTVGNGRPGESEKLTVAVCWEEIFEVAVFLSFSDIF